MNQQDQTQYVSRGGDKLAHALHQFSIHVDDLCCADLGSHVGGFVDCLIQRGAARVYSVDTSYGTLAWKLRKNDRVVVMERTNAMHVQLPEPVDLVTIDVGWTPQSKILPQVSTLVHSESHVITLIKPHYEANPDKLRDGVLPDEYVDEVISEISRNIESNGWDILNSVPSPIRGHGGNREHLALLRRSMVHE